MLLLVLLPVWTVGLKLEDKIKFMTSLNSNLGGLSNQVVIGALCFYIGELSKSRQFLIPLHFQNFSLGSFPCQVRTTYQYYLLVLLTSTTYQYRAAECYREGEYYIRQSHHWGYLTLYLAVLSSIVLLKCFILKFIVIMSKLQQSFTGILISDHSNKSHHGSLELIPR